MPIYEYECRKCKNRFELIQSPGKEESKFRCPKCQADKPRRVLSLFSSASSKSTPSSCGSRGFT